MKKYLTRSSVPFWVFHGLTFYALFFSFHFELLVLALALYFFRMFFVTAGYHRYFSHKTFTTTRTFQFTLAFMAMTSSQKGVLWWASHHRAHHQNSDTENDIHSPSKGFIWSHFGWILSEEHENTDPFRIKDLLKYPEFVWLDRICASERV